MKKQYKPPVIEIVVLENLMEQLVVDSVGKTGSVTGEQDTGWGFGGDGDLNDSPDAKKTTHSLWDGWDD